MELSYILNELGEDRDHYFNAVAPPIMQTSNFAFKTVAELRNALADESTTYLYSRGKNPTLDILCKKLAALDEAEDSLVFNSGASAIFCSVLANVKAGDHIVSVEKPYTWAQKLFNNILPRFNVSTTYVDGRNTENFERAIQPNTVIIYLESPSSWSFNLQDLRAVANLASSKNILTICDNSYSSPLFQKPIPLGIDLVLQSATKYISGHSDVVAGVLSGSKKMITKIFDSEYLNLGAGTTPLNAWLLIRGLRTIKLRLDRISSTTKQVVQFLKNHEKIETVIFPFDEDFAQYSLARQQMTGAGGLISFSLRVKSLDQVERFCEVMQHILVAVSWGGHESLVIPACASMPGNFFDPSQIEHRTVRMYVGLEDPEYLIAELKNSLHLI
jgi:cystathionine beta-lyase/cystathionine gamma-synthase